MKKSYLTAVLMLTCLLGVGVGVRAQDAEAVVVKVPFEFVAGGSTLPAGEYRVSRVSPGLSRELAIRGYNTGATFLLPLAFDNGAAAANQPTISFEHVGDKYFLSKIKTSGGVYTMPASREMVMLGKTNTPSPSTSSAAGGQ